MICQACKKDVGRLITLKLTTFPEVCQKCFDYIIGEQYYIYETEEYNATKIQH